MFLAAGPRQHGICAFEEAAPCADMSNPECGFEEIDGRECDEADSSESGENMILKICVVARH